MNVKRREAIFACASAMPRRNPPRRTGAVKARSETPGLNLRASFVQGKPRKTKENSLHFLAFPWPNWDFSKGCGESK
jgi:hypothetical protein